MIVIDSAALFLIVLVLAGTGLGITWLLVQRENAGGDNE